MFVTQLDVVNACLASMGESPVNSLDTNNIFITSALNAMRAANLEEQSFGWYFSHERVELKPTVEGEVFVPTDTIGLKVKSNPPWLSIRARRLYDNRKGQRFTTKVPVQVELIRLVTFEDLPYHAQRAVKAKTVIKFQQDYDGDDVKIDQASNEYGEARALLMAEHTRAVGANMLYQGGVGTAMSLTRYIHNDNSRFGGLN